jgi:serine-type D-Ala-D-Ala endopeptidase (penicillin-binding protein 7)
MRRIVSLLALFAVLCCGQSAIAKSVPITAKSWLVAAEDGKIIQGENIQAVRPIASISKLMTAMVIIDADQKMDEQVGQYTRYQLLQMMLVKSDNRAAIALCDSYPNGHDACVRAMNLKAKFLNLENTRFIEPSGLSVFNVSTATELVQLVLAAKEYPLIVKASQSSQIKIKIKKKWLIFNNTNPIIGRNHNFIVSKTGFINASGGCIVMMLDTDIGRRIVVVLGSKNTHTRIPEAEFIAKSQ